MYEHFLTFTFMEVIQVFDKDILQLIINKFNYHED